MARGLLVFRQVARHLREQLAVTGQTSPSQVKQPNPVRALHQTPRKGSAAIV